MTGDEMRANVAKSDRLATNGNTDEAIRVLGQIILAMADQFDPDVEALIEKQRNDGAVEAEPKRSKKK